MLIGATVWWKRFSVVRFWCILVFMSVVIGANRDAESMNKMTNGQDMVVEQIHLWLEKIDRVPEQAWVHIEDFASLDTGARTESMTWCDRVLLPAANPYREGAAARHAYFLASRPGIDLFRHDVIVRDVGALTVFESVNFLILRLTPDRPTPFVERTLENIALALINSIGPDYEVTFKYPDVIQDNTIISTAPNIDPFLMESWTDRIDMVLKQAKIFFIINKTYPGVLGGMSEAQWFEPEFRTQ